MMVRPLPAVQTRFAVEVLVPVAAVSAEALPGAPALQMEQHTG